jgi:mannosidase alpha-like ER degradation enhancer 1
LKAIFEEVSKKALFSLWEKRSSLDLMGNVIDVVTGKWVETDSHIGAGIDSFHEYLIKSYILLGDDKYLEMFEISFDSIMKHVRDPNGFIYRPV